MIAHTLALGGESDGLTAHNPFGVGVEISATGDVGHLSVGHIDDCNVVVGIVLAVDNLEGDPLGVGRPRVSESSFAAEVGGAVGELAYFLALEVHHMELGAVEDECEGLAVWRYVGSGAFMTVGLEYGLFVDDGGMGEVGFVGALVESGAVDVVLAVALAHVVEGRVVAPADHRFSFRSIGNLLCRVVVGGCYEYIASYCECNLRSVGRYDASAGTSAFGETLFFFGIVGVYSDFHFDRHGLVGSHCVDLAVVYVCQSAVVGAAQEAYGVLFER